MPGQEKAAMHAGARVVPKARARFEQAVFMIAVGLQEKDAAYEKESRRYPYSQSFRCGLNAFAVLSYECSDGPCAMLDGLSESSFIRDYASRPVREWVRAWRPECVVALGDSPYLDTDSLVEATDDFYALLPECYDLILHAESNVVSGYQERDAYLFLREESQEHYAFGRRFLVRHPILTWDDYHAAKTMRYDFAADPLDQGEWKAIGQSWMEVLLETAYEPVSRADAKVCPRCGWTMVRHGRQPHCSSAVCATHLPADFSSLESVPHDAMRLKHGVMHYICAPGSLELAIAETVNDLGFSFEMWPMKDVCDVLVTLPDGTKLAIDAKAYSNPQRLAREIRNDTGTARVHADLVRYVIPDESKKKHPSFCAVCNDALRGKRGYACVTLKELKRFLSDAKENR